MQRYSIIASSVGGGVWMKIIPDPHGEWVRWEDLEPECRGGIAAVENTGQLALDLDQEQKNED